MLLFTHKDYKIEKNPVLINSVINRGYQDIAFSLCGRLHEYEGDFPESLFLQSLVTYDDFCENTNILDNPDLVIRCGGKYLNWAAAAPQIMSLVLFQRPVPQVNIAEKCLRFVNNFSPTQGYKNERLGFPLSVQQLQKHYQCRLQFRTGNLIIITGIVTHNSCNMITK